MEKLTKSGHKIYCQNCFSEYDSRYTQQYKHYEYILSDSCLYIYEDRELIYSCEIWREDAKYRENWAKYYINQLVNKEINSVKI